MAYQPIGNHGVIGDLNTVALVSIDGSIDFMCFPDFDSPTIFGRLLDDTRGGYFQIAPARDDGKHKQLYLSDTNVLFTRFLFGDGVAELSDFMPVEEERIIPNVVRRVKAIRGTIEFEMICQPAFDYARADHEIQIEDHTALIQSRGPSQLQLRLRSEVPLEIHEGALRARFTLQRGESVAFILEQVLPGLESPCNVQEYVSKAFKNTVNYWHHWMNQSRYQGRWREIVNRSALVLKLMTSQVHGSMIAAPTFGLPEAIGGERNWDYRYSWIRDSAFTVYAFLRLGFREEAEAFMDWIKRCGSDLGEEGTLQVLYGVDGRKNIPETVLEHLEGYRGSTPVRIGNEAYTHLQLDIYGELLDAIYLSNKYGPKIDQDLWRHIVTMMDYLVHNWDQPDEGVWEVRGGRRDFLFSRLMSWVALDRALRMALETSFPAPISLWRETRDEIYRQIHEEFWDREKGAFVQYRGGKALDASSLLMPLVKFISPTDPRWLSHLEAVEEELVYDSLVYRYSQEVAAHDGLLGGEGTFSICTFWYVECLSRAGQLQKARFYLEKILGYANHLGLYAEELGPQGEQLGNFPQAFTHLSLISAAYDLNRRLTEAGE
jgi:GH15 family glucan-1,4-alpha-glucosidase